MNEHEEIRLALSLAASDAASTEDLRRVEDHLRHCEPCRRESEDFAVLAETLRRIPTPQPRAELVDRVRQMAESRLRERPSAGSDVRLLAPLVAASWVVAWLTWPVARVSVSWMMNWMHVPEGEIGTALGVYSAVGFIVACISAAAVARRAGMTGRTR